MFLGSYICGRNGDGSKVRGGLQHKHNRFFEDFSYGKQSLDGLLFPQRAFFILGLVVPACRSLTPSPRRRPAFVAPLDVRPGSPLTAQLRAQRRPVPQLLLDPVSIALFPRCFLHFSGCFACFLRRFFSIFASRLRICFTAVQEEWLTGEIAQLVRAQDS